MSSSPSTACLPSRIVNCKYAIILISRYVFSPSRVSGSDFRSMAANISCSATQYAYNPPVVPLLHIGCDNRVDVMPGSTINASFYLPDVSDVIENLVDIGLQFLADTRLDKLNLPPLTDAQFTKYFR